MLIRICTGDLAGAGVEKLTTYVSDTKEDLEPYNFNTVDAMCALIEKLQNK